MTRRRLLIVVLPIVLAAAALFMLQSAGAANILANGGFEQWTGAEPDNWSPMTTTVTRATTPAVSGFAVQIDGDGLIKQTLPALPFGSYTAAAHAARPAGAGQATLRLRFLDSGFQPVGQADAVATVANAFTPLNVLATAPAAAAWVEFVLQGGPGTVFDAATLDETPGATPTPVPTEVPLPTAVPSVTPVPPSPGPTSPGGGGTVGPTPQSSPTVRPTSTPRPPTAAPTARAPTQAVVRTPTAARPRSISPVRPEPNTDAGGLLANGDFERVDDSQPSFWRKFGGSMFSVSTFHGGATGGLLLSGTTSTKWLYQDSPVEPGAWYEGRAWAQIPSGEGAVFIRLAWYPTPDASGRRIEAVDSEESTSHNWTELTTGPVQAPAGARSVRFRLVLRPRGPSSAVFDDASLLEVDEPAAPAPGKRAPEEDEEGEDLPSGIRLPQLAYDGLDARSRDQSAPGLRISEVLPDPAEPGTDAAFEWVELVNEGDTAIDLSGWRLGDARQLDPLPATIVPPGGSVVVAGRSALLPGDVTVVRVADGQIGSGLNNGGDSVRLVAPDGSIADALSFGSDSSISDPAPPAPGAGRSLYRDRGGGSWAVSIAPGPGQAEAAPAGSAPTAAGAGIQDEAAAADADGDGSRPPVVAVSRSSSNAPYYVLGALAGAGAFGLAGLARQRFRRRDGG